MKAVAIRACCRIWVSSEHRLTVNTLGIAVIRMAGGTLLDDATLISLPSGHFMDVAVAVLTLNLMSIMGTRIMFRSLPLVTAMAGG